MQDRYPPALRHPRDWRQLVSHPGGQHNARGTLLATAAQRHGEPAVVLARRKSLAVDQLDRRVGAQLARCFLQDGVGRFAVLPKEAVPGGGEAVAGQTGVDHQYAAAGASELHRGG